MPLYTGNNKIGSLYLGSTKIKEAWVGDVKVFGSTPDPYNPLNLPPSVFRCKYEQGYDPRIQISYGWCTDAALVDSTENIWDITEPLRMGWCYDVQTIWPLYKIPIIEILGANTTNFRTDTKDMLEFCDALPPEFQEEPTLLRSATFDTRHITIFMYMFAYNTKLESVPLLPTDSAINVHGMFINCTNVTSGALAMYQQMASNPRIFDHDRAFENCGINTTTGLAELQQIPQSWGGLAPG